jgi:hypothetical protein
VEISAPAGITEASDPRIVFERQLSRTGIRFLSSSLSNSQLLLVGSECCRTPEVNAVSKEWVALQTGLVSMQSGELMLRNEVVHAVMSSGPPTSEPTSKCMVTICRGLSETL